MSLLRFVSLLAFATLTPALVAQSIPATHANQTATRVVAQDFPNSASAQSAPSGQSKLFAKTVVDPDGYGDVTLAMADLNGDGHLDLVVASADTALIVLLGNGDGSFHPAGSYVLDTYPSIMFVAIGDVNGDGYPDLVVSAYNYQSSADEQVNVLLGNGDGTFQPPATYNTGGEEGDSVVIADLNGDGHPDLVVANECQSIDCASPGGGLSVLLGNGDGTFQSPVTYDSAGVDATSVAVADVNGDGHPDLVVANLCQSSCLDGRGEGGVSLLLGNGDGTFQPAVSFDSRGVNSDSVVVADLNGDGHPDVIVANACQTGSCSNGGVSVLLGNGDGTFQAPAGYTCDCYGANSIVVADLNGDGNNDLVVAGNRISAHPAHGEVSVLLGSGDGTFMDPATFASGGYGALSLASGDLNGDGRPDVVVGNIGSGRFNVSNTVGVLLNILAFSTTTTVTSSVNPSLVNQSVTFTATISSSGSVPKGSTVTFYHGNTVIGTAATTNGVATLTTSFSKAGKFTIKATFPKGGFLKASSDKVTQVVNN